MGDLDKLENELKKTLIRINIVESLIQGNNQSNHEDIVFYNDMNEFQLRQCYVDLHHKENFLRDQIERNRQEPTSKRQRLDEIETDEFLFKIPKLESDFCEFDEKCNEILQGRQHNQTIYWRSECHRLYCRLNFFLNQNESIVFIQGSPGVGKSSTVFKWACDQKISVSSLESSYHVVWIAYDTTKSIRVFIFDSISSDKTKINVKFLHMSDFKVFIHELKTRFNETSTIIVFDNCKDSTYNEVKSAMLYRSSRWKIIGISSMQLKTSDQSLGYPSTMKMIAWSLKDYLAACSNDRFYYSIENNLRNLKNLDETMTREDIIMGKYYYAGSSARWMFQFDIQKTKDDIWTHISNCSNYAEIINGTQGNRSLPAVNHLVCLIGLVDEEIIDPQEKSSITMSNMLSANEKDNNTNDLYPQSNQIEITQLPQSENNNEIYSIVSEYVILKLSEKVERKILREFSSINKRFKNPCIDGWLLEMDIVNRITGKHGISVMTDGGCKNLSSGHKYHTFCEKRQVDLSNISNLESNDWFLPENFNNAGFDMVQYTKNNDNSSLIFLQITRSLRHSMKFEYFDNFVDEFKRYFKINFVDIEILVVVPNENKDKYKKGKEWTNISNQKYRLQLCGYMRELL